MSNRFRGGSTRGMASPSPGPQRGKRSYMGSTAFKLPLAFCWQDPELWDLSFWHEGITLSLSGVGVLAEAPLGWRQRVVS